MDGYAHAQQRSNAAPVIGGMTALQNCAKQPANLQVKAGATMTRTNQDTAPHAVTVRASSLTSSSGILRQGDAYRCAFTQVGAFQLLLRRSHVRAHTYMVGSGDRDTGAGRSADR